MRLPISFQPVDARAVTFVSHGNGRLLQVSSEGAEWTFGRPGSRGKVLSMHLRGANPAAEPIELDQSSATANYLMGNDPSQWRLAVPSFHRVGYRRVYPG